MIYIHLVVPTDFFGVVGRRSLRDLGEIEGADSCDIMSAIYQRGVTDSWGSMDEFVGY